MWTIFLILTYYSAKSPEEEFRHCELRVPPLRRIGNLSTWPHGFDREPGQMVIWCLGICSWYVYCMKSVSALCGKQNTVIQQMCMRREPGGHLPVKPRPVGHSTHKMINDGDCGWHEFIIWHLSCLMLCTKHKFTQDQTPIRLVFTFEMSSEILPIR